jgi:hypothetical protein
MNARNVIALLLSIVATALAILSLSRAPSEPGPIMAATGGPQFTGEQSYGADMRLYEAANNAQQTQIAAGACANIDTTPVMKSGEYDTIWQGTIFDYAAPSQNCDGGGCSAFLTSMLAVDSHGGGFCQMGGASCTNADGGGLDTQLQSYPPGGATLYGGTAHLVVNVSAATVSLQACCGPTLACRARGRISATRGTPFSSSSSGGGSSSSGSSSGSSSSSSSGGSTDGGLLVSVLPDFFPANGGGWNLTMVGSGTPSLVGATVTIGGTPATVVSSTATTLVVTAPAASDPVNGLTIPPVVTVTTTGALVLHDKGVVGDMAFAHLPYVIDGGIAVSSYVQDAGTDGGLVALYDLSGNGCTLLPVSVVPAAASTGGGTSGTLPVFAVTALTQKMACAGFPATAGIGSWIVYGQFNPNISAYIADLGVGNIQAVSSQSTSSLSQYAGTAPENQVTYDAGAWHVLTSVFSGANSYQDIDCVLRADAGVTPGSAAGAGGISMPGSAIGNSQGGNFTTIIRVPFALTPAQQAVVCAYRAIEGN